MKDIFKGKTILVTGGCGSIGSEIVRQVLQYEPKQIRIFDNRETELFHLQHELSNYKNVRMLLGDIRDKERLIMATEGVDIVFHSAALKHVPLCEYNPFEAMKTNVEGTQNVIDACFKNNVKKMINISTDKVTNAINTMGATKLLAEKLVKSAEHYKGFKKTNFSSVRFGNVLGSRGSVIDLFKQQVLRKNPLTITHPDMTRFIMSIPDAVYLVLKTAQIMQGGEIFVLKMPTFKLQDLVDIIIEEFGDKNTKTTTIGLRPGEKMYEDLIIDEELANAVEIDDLYIVQSGINTGHHTNIQVKKYEGAKKVTKMEYNSGSNLMSKEELKKILKEKKIL